MSRHFQMFVEKKENDKYILLNDSYIEIKRFIGHFDFEYENLLIADKNSLSQEMKDKFHIDTDKDFYTIKEISFSEIYRLFHDYRVKVEISLTTSFLAMGMNYRFSEFDSGDDFRKYDEDDNIRDDYNPMTHPVNKELLELLNDYLIEYDIMREFEGVVYTLKELYDIHYDNSDDFRILIVSC